ncbi:MarR family transcriptional regulator [Streptomyces sp. RLB3-17]|nr:MarR family transcriptional regulator [Streptomyces sp. RLA2-12]QDN63120.1 MarR family transcriptional regulator [Streptomyces sp. S1D4-20]QDN73172.1 MarR family transcriptional regulator [Streptomyces sp. S1D4-14]QDO03882.1 MarR family transcriptional regulator [Streptomyces sp. RLB1-9]QDO25613.1 MarR family transcriptional regulator [Streptomyces sp. S1A1-8]QDO35730.1 MarR family transcriptional regulator [Streptomyces sp. S1A1-3]QDO45751.1 MarR family transcriptional regulator [Streptom
MAADAKHPRTEAGAHEPRWLTDDEQDAWLSLAAVVTKLPAVLDAQLQRDAGITLFEYLVLAGLSEAPDRARRMSDLAVLANASLSRLSHVIKRLERRGWVRREPCPKDRRCTNAILTETGWAKTVATAPGHVEAVRHLVIDALTVPQLSHLTGISHRILHRIDPGNPRPTESTRRTSRADT